MADASHHNVLIIGGGTAGITVAASLQKRQGSRNLSIAIVEPTDTHYYQPAFTLVGAGTYSLAKTSRREAQLIPSGVDWIQDSSMSAAKRYQKSGEADLDSARKFAEEVALEGRAVQRFEANLASGQRKKPGPTV